MEDKNHWINFSSSKHLFFGNQRGEKIYFSPKHIFSHRGFKYFLFQFLFLPGIQCFDFI